MLRFILFLILLSISNLQFALNEYNMKRNEVTLSGLTRLHIAVLRQNINAVRQFLDEGDNINAKNLSNKTPINLSKNPEITGLLKKSSKMLLLSKK